MDAGRFDALSRSIAARSSRRSALRRLGAGGLAAGVFGVFGAQRAPAASGSCELSIFAKTSAGPSKNVAYTGTLRLEIGDDGAIDAGSFDLDNGASLPLVGQATGRALNLRVTLEDGGILALNGTAELDLVLCRGGASGVFGGPKDADIGTWRTGGGSTGGSTNSGGSTTSTGGGSSSGGSTGGGSSSGGGGATTTGNSSNGGNSSGGGSTSGGGNSSDGGGGDSACPSGVVCNGVCCAPAPGLTADTIVCNAGACECAYSCASAGCPSGGTQGSIVNTCGSDPEPHCHSECNFPDDNGCGDLTCGDGMTLDVDSCTCVAPDGAQDDCGGADLMTDPQNCGSCGNVCPSGQCIEGNCTDVVK